MTKFIYKHRYFWFLILIIAVAIFFRFWQFTSVPSGLYQDEAMNGADAIASIESGNFSVFYQNNNGREGMIIWLDALAIKIFGAEPWVLRLFPAIAGVLAVLGLFFLTKELFSIEIALASSFFMAVSFWAVNFSRIGFRAGLMLPFLIWSFYFLHRGFKLLMSDIDNYRCRTSIISFVSAGVLFGLGFYTYISYRFAPVLFLVYFLHLLIKCVNKKLWMGFFVFAAIAFIIALPIGLYFLDNPQDFFGRSGQVSVFSAENPIKAAALSVVAAFGMFNIIGDFNWRHNYAGFPGLFWPVGLLFLFGLYLSFRKFQFREKFLLSWFFIFLFPNILSTEGNPHALRALGAMPAAMVFAGIGLIWIYEKIKKYLNNKIFDPNLIKYRARIIRIKKEAFILLVIFLFFISSAEFNKYFIKWASNQNTVDAFSYNQVEIANYLNSLPQDVKKYAIWPSSDRATSNGLPVSAQTVYFLAYKKSDINYVKSDEADGIKLDENGTVIIPLYFNLELLHNLNKKFPDGKIEFIYLNTPILIVP